MGILLAGCRVRTTAGLPPVIPSRVYESRPAPRSVMDRMTIAVPDLYFGAGSHVLSSRERRKLAQIAPALQDILRDFPDLIIVIEGYSDDWYRPEYNEQLGWRRADAVRRFLLDLSFPEDCLRVVSFGYRAPQCESQDDRCRQQNRRVHFRAAITMTHAPPNKP